MSQHNIAVDQQKLEVLPRNMNLFTFLKQNILQYSSGIHHTHTVVYTYLFGCIFVLQQDEMGINDRQTNNAISN